MVANATSEAQAWYCGDRDGKDRCLSRANCEGLHKCCWSSCRCKVEYQSQALRLLFKTQAYHAKHYYQGYVLCSHASQATEIARAGFRVLPMWRLSSVVKQLFPKAHT